MRKIFINEVVKYALIIGISVIALVWAALSRSTMSTLEATLDNYLQSSINIIEFDNKQHDILLEDYKAESISTATSIALLIQADSTYLSDQKLLDDLRKTLRLDEILVTDENSSVIASSSINGSIKNPCVHIYEFTSGIYQTDYKKYIEPLFCDSHKAVLQYTGVSRKDKPGVVIIAKKSENIASIIKSNIANELPSIYPIYKNGFIAIIDKDTHTIISYKDNRYLGADIKELGIDINLLRSATKVLPVTIDSKDAFALLRDKGNYSLIAIAYEKDVYFTVYVYIIIIIVSILLMIIFMQLFILQVVNEHIISGISYIINCLNSITKDNLDTKVELNTCDEFSILSESINSMVSRLKNLLLTEKKLVSEKELLAAAKGDFLAMMSHEIRTPLNVIIGMAQMGMRTDFDENRVKDAFTNINMASTHLLSLLNDILDMSKIDAGKLELSLAPFSLKDDINHIQILVSPKIKEQELFLITNMADIENDIIIGDKLRLNQVLLNLLSNAVKFTGKGKHIRLSVSCLSSDDENITLRFTVSDEGIGMSKEKIEKIFNPFEQADTSISRNFGGTGLGLSISNSIVELMGSKINVESHEGRGSKFWFDVTFKRGECCTEDKLSKIIIDNNSLKDYRLLLVDDVLLNRKVICTFLEKTGIKIDEAESGSEAVKMYLKSPDGYYDFILMDIHMPNMNGYEATEAIRKSSKMDALSIPIIAVTADAFKETEQQVLECGMNGFIAKPVNFEKLNHAIIKALNNKLNKSEKIMVWTKINNLD